MKRSTVILSGAAVAYVLAGGTWGIGWIDKDILLAFIGAVSAFVFFLMENALETARFKRELFVAFNETYGKLNDKLDDALKHARDGNLSDSDKKHLEDYFNLCSEEYFYYRKGYVDAEVWRNWLIGMNWWYDSNEEIAEYWRQELEKGSYYGMNLATLRGDRPRDARLTPSGGWRRATAN